MTRIGMMVNVLMLLSGTRGLCLLVLRALTYESNLVRSEQNGEEASWFCWQGWRFPFSRTTNYHYLVFLQAERHTRQGLSSLDRRLSSRPSTTAHLKRKICSWR